MEFFIGISFCLYLSFPVSLVHFGFQQQPPFH